MKSRFNLPFLNDEPEYSPPVEFEILKKEVEFRIKYMEEELDSDEGFWQKILKKKTTK